MYIPSYFAFDSESSIQFMRDNSFAALIVSGEFGMDAVHIPLLISESDPLTLVGHVAKANPIWKTFDEDRPALVIFSGPHAYISPKYYSKHPSVPTWNYVVVHAHGKPKIVRDPRQVIGQLRNLVDVHDPELGVLYPEGLTDDYLNSMANGIVAFEMIVEKFEGKAKLNQNRNTSDQLSVQTSLSQSVEPLASQIANWMNRLSN